MSSLNESTDAKQSRVFAVAGVVGQEHVWQAAERSWVERTGGVVFHATDCEYRKDLELYKDLIQILSRERPLWLWESSARLPPTSTRTHHRHHQETLAMHELPAHPAELHSQTGAAITRWHLQYPLELLTKTVQILATHPHDARTRLVVAWKEFAILGGLLLRPSANAIETALLLSSYATPARSQECATPPLRE